MFVVNDDLSICVTRGDILFFSVTADDHGVPYHFQPGDIVRMAVYGKKDATVCYLQKDFPVTEVCERVFIFLEEKDTKIGDIISKPKDYWYEVVLNPDTMPQTLIGYDEEDGPRLFQLLPESVEIEDNYNPQPEDFPVVDTELDLNSPRPVANSAVTRELLRIPADKASVLQLNCFEEILAYKEKVSNSFICGNAITFPDTISGLSDCYLRFDPSCPFIWKNKDSWKTGYYENGWVYQDRPALTLSGLENVTFDGLTFLSDIDDADILTWTGIRLENCKNVKFVNCNIQGFKWIGIDVSNVGNSDITICNSLIRRCRFNIYNAGVNTRIDGNTITDDYETTEEYKANGGWVSNTAKDSLFYDGIVETGSKTIIANNHIYQVGQSGIYSPSCNGVKVSGNVCENNYNGGIDFGANSPAGDAYAMNDVTITDNLCRANKSMGFNVTNGKGFYLCGNKSIDNGDACFSVEGKSTECYFVSNYCLSGAKRGISFGLNVSHCVAIGTVGSCGDRLVAIPSDCDESVKDFPYNRVNTESVTIEVPFGGDDIASKTVMRTKVNDSLAAQYWYANKPVDLRASEASGDFQKFSVGDFVAKNQITDSIWANNFIRLPHKAWTAAGAIWFNPDTKKLEFYDGTNHVTLATE